ncbi:MAG TPA: hypothetical protein VK636_05510, partial [Gemmatimonadaceae bacterium]|nr:hypothetical protein [Gemmatimonadaceae bacterium]
MNALRALLSGIVDYAGLFPPAALDMPTAVRNFASYRREAASWMLGRFVVPVARLDEFAHALSGIEHSDGPVWRLSGLLGADVTDDVAHARKFNAANVGRATIDSLEGKLPTANSIGEAAILAGDTFELFVEIPLGAGSAALIDEVARVGAKAKVRTGGVTSDSIPSAAAVIGFMRHCLDADVPFKATAGLHHPVRADYRLTYEAEAPHGVMFGYLNVFLAAGFLRAGMDDELATDVLNERDAATIEMTEDAITWRGHALHGRDLSR